MRICCRAERILPCSAEHAFALATDSARFPEFFRGFGPIPAVRGVEPHGPTRVGSTRTVRNADGSVLHEAVTAFEPPHRHVYRLQGFRAPFSWLVRQGDADWRVAPVPGGAHVAWIYDFTLVHPLAWPLARPLLVFMGLAMRRCLSAMARAAAQDASPMHASP